jgi:ABC-type amino acid transport substrate-binding protein
VNATTDLSTVDVLRRAKQVLIERGWTQGAYECISKDACGVCAIGAINAAAHDGDADWESYQQPQPVMMAVARMEEAVAAYTDDGPDGIVGFNDDVAKSVDDVLAAFDKAIALAETEAGR